MIEQDDKLYKDFETIKRIPIVETMLEVICRTTGMGFAAVARVTTDRWLACQVRDEIQFGLSAGEELKIETTICNEIRGTQRPVIINHVAEDQKYREHHTPLMYGFQSYISFPIIKTNGDFFGTLCAIDPRPIDLNNPKIIGTFTLFTELLSFHLQSIDQMERTQSELKAVNHSLAYTQEENRQYQMIAMHSLQEPLRKIRIFSDRLISSANAPQLDNTIETAAKINLFAAQLSAMIEDISQFSSVHYSENNVEKVNLNGILSEIILQLKSSLDHANISIEVDCLPVIEAIPVQIAKVFMELIGNAIKYSKKDIAPLIRIYSRDPDVNDLPPGAGKFFRFSEIIIEDNGVGIEEVKLQKLFNVFERINPSRTLNASGHGLSYCRKIIHQHGGNISVQSQHGRGTSFSIVIPVEKID